MLYYIEQDVHRLCGAQTIDPAGGVDAVEELFLVVIEGADLRLDLLRTHAPR